jgi:DNA-binding response OmpR family regulator
MGMQDEILIVDDCEDMRALLGLYMKKAGFSVCEASSGKEALRLLSHRSVALALLDLSLPGNSSLETLEEMRKDHGLIELPILVIASNTDSRTIVRALRFGANDYIPKPVDMPTLIARVDVQLSRRRIFMELSQTKKDLDQAVAAKSVEKSHELFKEKTVCNVAYRAIKRDVETIEQFLQLLENEGEFHNKALDMSKALRICRRVREECELLGMRDMSLATQKLELALVRFSKQVCAHPESFDEALLRLSASLTELWECILGCETNLQEEGVDMDAGGEAVLQSNTA